MLEQHNTNNPVNLENCFKMFLICFLTPKLYKLEPNWFNLLWSRAVILLLLWWGRTWSWFHHGPLWFSDDWCEEVWAGKGQSGESVIDFFTFCSSDGLITRFCCISDYFFVLLISLTFHSSHLLLCWDWWIHTGGLKVFFFFLEKPSFVLLSFFCQSKRPALMEDQTWFTSVCLQYWSGRVKFIAKASS